MQPKNLVALGILTALIAIGAVLAVRDRAPRASGGEDLGRSLPVLAERLNEVARIEVEKGGESFALTLEGDAWTMPAFDGYPVKIDMVRRLLISLSELENLEAMTDQPEHFERVGLLNPEVGSETAILRLADQGGNSLGAIMLGNRQGGRGKPALFARDPDQDQTYLAAGNVYISETPKSWLETEVLNIDSRRLKSVSVEQADGSVMELSKEKADDIAFELGAIPEGQELVSVTATSPMASALAYLNLDDVKRGEASAFAGGQRATFKTFDGLVIEVRTIEEAEDEGLAPTAWSMLEARYEEPPAEEADADEEDEHEHAEGDGHDHGDGDDAPKKSPAEVRQEVAAINARVAGWAYAFPSYKSSNFTKAPGDYLQDVPEPEPEEAETGEAPLEGEGDAAAPNPDESSGEE